MKKANNVDTLFEMFQAVLKSIRRAYQDDKDKIPGICDNASKNIEKLQKRVLVKRSL